MTAALVLAAMLPALAADVVAAGAAAPAADARIPLVLLSLRPDGVDAGTATALTGMLAADIDDIGALSLVTDEDVKRALDAERLRVLLACSDEAKCLSDFQHALGARHLVTGSVAKVDGGKLSLSLALLDLQEVRALGHETAVAEGAAQVRTEVAAAVGRLLAPLLAAHVGTLAVSSNEEGAIILVDGSALGPGPLRKTQPAGVHRVEAQKDGFITSSVDVLVEPGRARAVQVVLVPSAERAEQHRRTAWWLWGGAGAAAALGVASLSTGASLWAAQALRTDELAKSAIADPSGTLLLPRDEYDRITAMRVGGYALMGLSVPLVGAGGWLFLSTDPPWKYDNLLEQ